ncbi:polyketide synthase [Crocosphaera subtropica ATCC 51142]|uniref:Polyketide synthase n=2 Tax=Crocosphaera TaxID=263510 RepID=B1X1S9_CROS5|nr:polyketide synthase [Crocosphaera subtropica ATCC 51142]
MYGLYIDARRYLGISDDIKKVMVEHIAIIGLGCRFPQANNVESFWQLLKGGKDGIREVPPERWNVDDFYDPQPITPGKMSTRRGGFLDQVDQFDAGFFQISPREAEQIDPQQRLFLEVAWEALENAGLIPSQLSGTQTGVFVGINNSDYNRMSWQDFDSLNAYSGTGTDVCIVANRLSYFLNLKGPSLAINTACSSSLVAIHYACQSLRLHESNLCLAGGVSLILSPEVTIAFSQGRMMAADGRCKTFDASADGYVRGEGCGVIVLKRLSDALKDGDQIQGIIRGSAVNQDGLTNGLTAPNGPSQQAVMGQALKNANLQPHEISYVEAHGTGTPLGDPQEFRSITTVLKQGRQPEQTCWVGSVKTNIGHLESASGIAGVIKTVLCLQHQTIVPHLNLNQLNPYISLKNIPFTIPQECTPWTITTEKRWAGVSSFGFGGTNGHIILEEPPSSELTATSQEQKPHSLDHPYHLLTLSAQSKEALQALVKRYQDFLNTHQAVALQDVCFTANTKRSQFEHRLAMVVGSSKELQQQLATLINHPEESAIRAIARPRKSPKMAFMFTGQGSQFVGMGQQLYQTSSFYRQIIDECDRLLQPYLERSLIDILYEQTENSLLDQTIYTQPALFSLEYALAKLWQSWGVNPVAMMGHSVGEYVAACLAGVFSLEDGLKLIAYRGRLMQALPENGAMVAVFISEKQAQALIESYGDKVALAAINGPNSVVISGERDSIQTLITTFDSQGIQFKELQVSHAFHSPLMKPMLAEFEQVAQQITYNLPKIPIISNLTGEIATDAIASSDYWSRHILQPVKFSAGMQTLAAQGYDGFIEVGPKPILLGMGRRCLPENQGLWLPSLRPGYSDWQTLLESLGNLYVKGTVINWDNFYQDVSVHMIAVPTYPFQRQRYWFQLSGKRTYVQSSVPSQLQAANPSHIEQNKLIDTLKQTPNKSEQEALLTAYVEKKVLKVLKLPSSEQINPEKSLSVLGFDSLMLMELKNLMEKELNITLSTKKLLNTITPEKLTKELIGQLLTKETEDSISRKEDLPRNWLEFYQPQPQANYRLFCLHHLGGNASLFQKWSSELEPKVEVVPLQILRKSQNINQTNENQFHLLIEAMEKVLAPYLDKPFAIYGHSMGAIMAFELAQKLSQTQGKLLQHLFVSSSFSPQKINRVLKENQLSLEEILNVSEIPEEIRQDSSMMEEITSIFQVDLQLLKSYVYTKNSPLNCPISTFGGKGDPLIKQEDLLPWADHTHIGFRFMMFPGNHMFLMGKSHKLLLQTILKEIEVSALISA